MTRAPGMHRDGCPLLPFYEQIRQFGLEAQLTTEPWLYKMEAIRRSGASNLLGEEEDYGALIVGVERTLYTLFDSPYDLTLLGEWLYDERGSRATSAWQNDVYLTGFLAFNDVQGTELIAACSPICATTRALSTWSSNAASRATGRCALKPSPTWTPTART